MRTCVRFTTCATTRLILDIGPTRPTASVSWCSLPAPFHLNGPLGVFEFEQFGEGPRAISQAIARSKAFSLAGGGDTLAAIEKYNIEDGISYILHGRAARSSNSSRQMLRRWRCWKERAKV